LVFPRSGEGQDSTGININGAIPTTPDVNMAGTGIDLHSGDIFEANLTYNGTNLVLTLTDTVTKAALTHSFPINIPATVGGNTAYVGFTGGTGLYTATEEIPTWDICQPTEVTDGAERSRRKGSLLQMKARIGKTFDLGPQPRRLTKGKF
jgi:hypothetical protein